MVDLDGMEGITFNDVWEGRANIIDWINDPDTWTEGARHVNETINPIYQAYGHGLVRKLSIVQSLRGKYFLTKTK